MLSSLILHHNNEPFLDQIVLFNENWILCDNQGWPAQWMAQEEAPKHFWKAKLHQKKKKKIMVIVCWSAAHLIHYSFLNPDETITSEKYAQAHQWDALKTAMPVGCIAQQKEPSSPLYWQTTLCITKCLKNWMNWVTMFCLIHHIHLTSHQPTTISSSILTTFCRENASTTSRRQKMLSKSSSNPKAWILFNRNKKTDFSLAKMCW